ncbi:urease accessory protein UreH domain-containing protein [Actinoplanes sp. RD1]|uniref:urease accessory protein UreH domain-containing protein n=1 Tax=Actinoplanes sp. RD1 TaxID=3064538 RepID=UPI00274199B3|nr:sulfite exporter TauE/SafE family protein [Actinoplanes sp. RD1]
MSHLDVIRWHAATGRPVRRLLVVAALVLVACVLSPAGPAAAHPLGNFSVNRYAGLTLHQDRVEAVAAVDLAELPTLQDPAASCAEVVAALTVTVDGRRLAWTVADESLTSAAGAGGLRTSRLDCRLSAPAVIRSAVPVTVDFRFRDDRIGWRELVAAGSGVRLTGSSLPAVSVSDELRRYPEDPLAGPADVRSASFTAAPGSGTAPAAAPAGSAAPGPLAAAAHRLDELVGGDRLTPLVGLLAVLLSLALGAAHAALPGHGKTVMAAYLAGSRGRPRDAVLVGVTVTATHTAAVLVLGLVLTVAAGVAGELVLGWLGLVSGVLVAAVGVGALHAAVRHRRQHHHHEHHEHHEHGPGKWGLAGLGVAGGLVPSPSALVVLLGAVALGRTVFGVLLVLAYGLGMAATLTAAGLLLVRVRDRLSGRLVRWSALAPPVTAALIVVVGLGLTGRALITVV